MSENEIDNYIEAGAGVAAATADDFEMTPAAPVRTEGARKGVDDARRAYDAPMAERLHPGVRLRYAPCERIPNRGYAHVKRGIDVLFSALAIVVLSPLLLACAIAVKATSPGQVFFRQMRWGRSRTRFECWKFRTMIVETPPNLPAVKFRGKDAYMTPVGGFLRRWSLDELPQLINILRGDMSIVGPRPVIIREEGLIEKRGPLNANDVRPGLTGWAQVNGRNLVTDEEKAYLDGEYVANMGLAFDARVFFRTFAEVAMRRGIDRETKKNVDGTSLR